MSRPVRWITALLATTLALTPLAHAATTASPGAGSFTQHTYPAGGTSGARDYWLYLPPGKSRAPRPLVVFLHGCNVTAEQSAAITRFNDLAAKEHFVVVYPQQTITANSSAPLADGNGIGCWNWFLPDNQQRDAGEAGAIAGITTYVAQTQRVDPRRIFVDGISAGADMAVILGATYPDLYASVAALAGCAYRTCGDVTGALTNQAMGTHARVVPMLVENGTADTLNNMAMASGLVSSWLGADDLADDGSLNGSIPRQPASQQSYDVNQTPQPGSGDACVHNNTLTCPGGVVGFQGGYPYTVASYDDAKGCDVMDVWLIHGMEHAYPDAPGDGPYTDPLGPDITTAAWRFFASHPMGGCHNVTTSEVSR
jgi:poly(hydroxyalkanoate) depolymerase family esterase